MQAIIHNWVCGVAFAGGLCAVCMYLCPAGRVKYVLQMASACVMVLAMFAPLVRMDPDAYASLLAAYREQSVAVLDVSDISAERLNRTVIEQECAEYILDKAQTFGISIDAVTVRVKWEDAGYWVPYEATYTVPDSTVITREFMQAVSEELGIPEERQNASETNE